MRFEVLGPVEGAFGTRIEATVVMLYGRGDESDAEALARAVMPVAIPGRDVTLNVTGVDELGEDGVAALKALADALGVAATEAGTSLARINVVAGAGSPVAAEVEASALSTDTRFWL